MIASPRPLSRLAALWGWNYCGENLFTGVALLVLALFALIRLRSPVALYFGAPEDFRQELYDTRRDPRELQPLAAADRQEEMRQALGRWLRQKPVAQGVELKQTAAPSQDIIRSLGYIE